MRKFTCMFMVVFFLLLMGNCFAQWPQDAPSKAISQKIEPDYDDDFKIHVWRSDGDVFVKYELIEDAAKILPWNYTFEFGNERIPDRIILHDQYGTSYSNENIYSDKIFKFCKQEGSKLVSYLDESRKNSSFTLIYEPTLQDPYFLEIPAESYFTNGQMTAPKLSIEKMENGYSLSWSTSYGATGYLLAYLGLPEGENLVTFDMGDKTNTEWTHYSGKKYFAVAILPYKNGKYGPISNVEILDLR